MNVNKEFERETFSLIKSNKFVCYFLSIPRFCSFQSDIECDPNFPYRQLNGSCNNLNNLWWGKAETPYKRYLDSDYADSK